jgi:hypothetical protein
MRSRIGLYQPHNETFSNAQNASQRLWPLCVVCLTKETKVMCRESSTFRGMVLTLSCTETKLLSKTIEEVDLQGFELYWLGLSRGSGLKTLRPDGVAMSDVLGAACLCCS